MLKKFLVEAFSSDTKIPSSTRILSAIVILDVLGVWSFMCVYKGVFLEIGYDNLFLIVSCLGLKIYNRKLEGKSNVD